jgi:zinc finger BED domain-containing protein 5/7/8/9
LWALQIYESTDISNTAQLLAYFRMDMNGQDIFELMKKNIESRGFKWENCVSVCTNGAPSMLGCKKGFVAYVLKVDPNVKTVHCMIQREALVIKDLWENLVKL